MDTHETAAGRDSASARLIRHVDLAGTVAATVLTLGVVFLPVVRETAIRPIVAFAFVLFVPGYALLAALFPASPLGGSGGGAARRDGHLDPLERLVLSGAASVVLVILASVGLFTLGTGLRPVPIAVALTLLTLAFVAAAGWQRRTIGRRDAPADVGALATGGLVADARARLDGRTHRGTVRALVLVLAVAVVAASAGVALTSSSGDEFTEFSLLSENIAGEPTAREYPTDLTVGEPVPVWLGVGNYEGRDVSYTVVVQFQRVAVDGDAVRVVEVRQLDRFALDVPAGETRRERLELAPALAGDDLRIAFLLYAGEPPATPTTENAYRELHLWVDVAPAE